MMQYNSLLEYSVSSDSWFIDQFELNEKRVWMADAIYKNKFFVLGGIDTSSQAVDFVEEIIPMGSAVSVKKKENKILEYSLEQNCPNPFNPATVIRYIIPDKEDAYLLHLKVTLRVYDILGREISTLVDKEKQPGNYEVVFNPDGLSSGVYFYRITPGNFSDTKKLILLK